MYPIRKIQLGFSRNFTEDPNKTLVTASSAIFITENKQSAPVAVVGFQFRLSTFYYKKFRNVTSSVSGQLQTG